MKKLFISKILLIGALMSALVSLSSCSDVTSELEVTDNVVFGLRVDEVHMNKAYIRFTHTGSQDDLWYYLVTDDTKSDAKTLIEGKVAEILEKEGKLVANNGVNKSLLVDSLSAKTDYRVIASCITEQGEFFGNIAELSFVTKRDPAVFEENPNWLVGYKERKFSETNPNLELEVFSCKVIDTTSVETYVPVVLSKNEFQRDFNGNVRSCFESYIYYLNNTEKVRWSEYVSSVDSEFTQDRLRHGDYMLFMIGVDTLGSLTGYYAQTEWKNEQEKMSEAYEAWLGNWAVLGETRDGASVRYDVEIVAEENNLYYRMKGWEATTAASLFTSSSMNVPSELPIQLYYERSTDKVYFVSEDLKDVADFNNAEMYDFYFYGCIDLNGNVVPVDMPYLKIASLSFKDANHREAIITPEIFSFESDGQVINAPFILMEYSYIDFYWGSLIPVTADSKVPLISTMKFVKG